MPSTCHPAVQDMGQVTRHNEAKAFSRGLCACESEQGFGISLLSAVRDLFVDAYSAISVVHQKVSIKR